MSISFSLSSRQTTRFVVSLLAFSLAACEDDLSLKNDAAIVDANVKPDADFEELDSDVEDAVVDAETFDSAIEDAAVDAAIVDAEIDAEVIELPPCGDQLEAILWFESDGAPGLAVSADDSHNNYEINQKWSELIAYKRGQASDGLNAQVSNPEVSTIIKDCLDGDSGSGFVFEFKAPISGFWTFSTEGSVVLAPDTGATRPLDTVISVRKDCLDANSEIACNDDVNSETSKVVLAEALEKDEIVYLYVTARTEKFTNGKGDFKDSSNPENVTLKIKATHENSTAPTISSMDAVFDSEQSGYFAFKVNGIDPECDAQYFRLSLLDGNGRVVLPRSGDASHLAEDTDDNTLIVDGHNLEILENGQLRVPFTQSTSQDECVRTNGNYTASWALNTNHAEISTVKVRVEDARGNLSEERSRQTSYLRRLNADASCSQEDLFAICAEGLQCLPNDNGAYSCQSQATPEFLGVIEENSEGCVYDGERTILYVNKDQQTQALTVVGRDLDKNVTGIEFEIYSATPISGCTNKVTTHCGTDEAEICLDEGNSLLDEGRRLRYEFDSIQYDENDGSKFKATINGLNLSGEIGYLKARLFDETELYSAETKIYSVTPKTLELRDECDPLGNLNVCDRAADVPSFCTLPLNRYNGSEEEARAICSQSRTPVVCDIPSDTPAKNNLFSVNTEKKTMAFRFSAYDPDGDISGFYFQFYNVIRDSATGDVRHVLQSIPGFGGSQIKYLLTDADRVTYLPFGENELCYKGVNRNEAEEVEYPLEEDRADDTIDSVDETRHPTPRVLVEGGFLLPSSFNAANIKEIGIIPFDSHGNFRPSSMEQLIPVTARTYLSRENDQAPTCDPYFAFNSCENIAGSLCRTGHESCEVKSSDYSADSDPVPVTNYDEPHCLASSTPSVNVSNPYWNKDTGALYFEMNGNDVQCDLAYVRFWLDSRTDVASSEWLSMPLRRVIYTASATPGSYKASAWANIQVPSITSGERPYLYLEMVDSAGYTGSQQSLTQVNVPQNSNAIAVGNTCDPVGARGRCAANSYCVESGDLNPSAWWTCVNPDTSNVAASCDGWNPIKIFGTNSFCKGAYFESVVAEKPKLTVDNICKDGFSSTPAPSGFREAENLTSFNMRAGIENSADAACSPAMGSVDVYEWTPPENATAADRYTVKVVREDGSQIPASIYVRSHCTLPTKEIACDNSGSLELTNIESAKKYYIFVAGLISNAEGLSTSSIGKYKLVISASASTQSNL